jgi:hypothetical protein
MTSEILNGKRISDSHNGHGFRGIKIGGSLNIGRYAA